MLLNSRVGLHAIGLMASLVFSCSSENTVNCESTTTVGDRVTNACEVAAALPPNWSLGTMSLAPASSLAITADITADADFVLRHDTVPLPDNCLLQEDCLREVRFNTRQGLDGIVLGKDADDGRLVRMREARIARNTVFRVRVSMSSEYPYEGLVVPVLTFVSPSSEPCPSGSDRCLEDEVCYAAGRSTCYHCDRNSAEDCACVSPEGDLPDGTDCQYMISPDQIGEGTCSAGTCLME